MKTKSAIFSVLVAILIASFPFLSNATTFPSGGLTKTDKYEIDSSTPGHQKFLNGVGFGTALSGYFVGGVYGLSTDAAGNITATSPNTTLSNYSVIQWTTPVSLFSFTLPNGLPGQSISIIKINSANTNASKITPTTKTGFTDITLTNQGDGVELNYVDDVIGWRCAGVFGGSTVGKCNP